MNKERLKELKKKRLLYEVCFVDEYACAIDDVTAYFYIRIKRVRELETESTYSRTATASWSDMEQQNKRYREALERLLKESRNYEKNTNLMSFLEGALESDSDE